MRPQQQNRRMRGRNGGGGSNNNNNNNNNNRKGPNPLTRSYESNGPDVKIRGSAQQIAEKYATLARDAQSSGDRVMAENYLQHAEHYNRIIAAAQAQFASQQIQSPRDDLDDDLDDAGFGFEQGMNGNGEQHTPVQQQAPVHQPQQHQPSQPANGSGPQPVIDGVPAEVALNSETPSQSHGGGRHRDRRHHNRNQMNGGQYNRGGPAEQAPAEAVAPSEAVASSEPIAAEPVAVEQTPAPAPVAEIAAPVAEAAPAAAAVEPQEAAASEEAPAKPRRGRRPRRTAEAEAEAPAGEVPAEG